MLGITGAFHWTNCQHYNHFSIKSCKAFLGINKSRGACLLLQPCKSGSTLSLGWERDSTGCKKTADKLVMDESQASIRPIWRKLRSRRRTPCQPKRPLSRKSRVKWPKSLDYRISSKPTATHLGISKVPFRCGRATCKMDASQKLHCEPENSETRPLALVSERGPLTNRTAKWNQFALGCYRKLYDWWKSNIPCGQKHHQRCQQICWTAHHIDKRCSQLKAYMRKGNYKLNWMIIETKNSKQ